MLKLLALTLVLAGLTGGQVSNNAEPVLFYIEDGSGVPGFQPTDRELARLALDAWSRESGGKLKFTESKVRDDALVRLRWVSANEGLFGQMQRLSVKGKSGAIVYVMPEVGSLGQPLSTRAQRDGLLRDTIVYLTCVHELGHAVGLPHTNKFEDIMYSFGFGGDLVEYFMRYRTKLKSRDDIPKYSGLSAADISFLRQLYR